MPLNHKNIESMSRDEKMRSEAQILRKVFQMLLMSGMNMLRETLPFSPLSARYRPTVYHLRPPDYSLLTKLSTTPVIQNIPTFPSLSNTTAPSCNTRQIRYREQTDGGEGRSPSSVLFQLQDQLQGQLTDHSKCHSHEGIY